MRIVAGEYRGRPLKAPAGRATRPTADRVREAVFNILGDVSGAVVLDLFAGSGALGIEALSRGAAAATFVDRDERALAAVRANLDAFGAVGRVVRGEAIAFLRRQEGAGYDLVFVDPPYDSAPELGTGLSELLPEVVAEDAVIVTESDKRSPLELTLPLVDERAYGDTRIGIHRA
ncbi:MAG: 16S rRNA (guanine(966)-N(2))-methyltransferase RsmD [Thermoleophilaceae bacterium]